MSKPFVKTLNTVVLFLLCWFTPGTMIVQGQGNPAILLPPSEHPRLFLRAQDLPTIKSNIQSDALKDIWGRLLKLSRDTPELAPADSSGARIKYEEHIVRVAEAKALVYLLFNERELGRQAIELMDAFLPKIVFPKKGDITREIGETILVGAMVYDWCYELMDGAERKRYISAFKQLASTMEMGYPPVKQNAIVGHGAEAQLFRDLVGAGIAVYDEDPEIYMQAAGRLFREFVPPRLYWYRSGLHHQGDSYGPYRYQWEMFATLIYNRMGFSNIFSEDQATIPYRWIYTRRPDGQLLRDGDSFLAAQTRAGEYWSLPYHLLLAAHYFRDPFLKHEFLKQYEMTLDRYDIKDIWMILFFDPNLKPEERKELPLTRYFPDPAGIMVARTGWDTGKSAATVVAEMKIGGVWFGNHQHLDAGHFQLYYKGALAIDAGVYEGKNGAYGSAHDFNYHKRTIAHNTVLVFDPNERFLHVDEELANDGGQRLPRRAHPPATMRDIESDEYRVAHVLAHSAGPNPANPEFSHLSGDIAPAYSQKVEKFTRSFTFLNLRDTLHPAALIVLDHVTSARPELRKSWVLHSIESPDVTGNIATITASGGYGGKLVNTTLLPSSENLRITPVGGAGREFEVNGVNFPQPVRHAWSSEEPGDWRIEISPRTPSKEDIFLNVLEVMDDGQGTAAEAKMIQDDQVIGVKIRDRFVYFPDPNRTSRNDLAIQVEGRKADSYKVLVTGLDAGTWTVTDSQGRVVLRSLVTEHAGTLYFETYPGKFALRRVSQSAE